MRHNTRQKRLVLYRAGSDLAAKSAFFVVTLVAARRLSTEAFGLFSLATTAGWIAAVIADGGLQLHLARAVSQQPEAASAILRRWFQVRWFSAATVTLVAAAGAIWTAGTVGASAAALVFVVAYGIGGVVEFLYYFFRALDRSDLESSLVLAQRGALLALGLAVLYWRPSVLGLAVAMLVPAVVTLAVALQLAARLESSDSPAVASPHQPGESSPVEPVADATRSVAAVWRRSVFPIGAGIVLSALYFRIDVFLLERWVGIEAVGGYNAAFRLVEALRLFPAAVLAVALPRVFQATSRGPLVRLAVGLFAAAMSVTVVVWLTASWLVPWLYGAPYAPFASVLQVLMLSFPLMALNYALTHQLIGWHRHWVYTAICGLALVGNVVINLRAIPAAGAVGAAWTTLATEAIVTIGCLLALSGHRAIGGEAAAAARREAVA